MVDHVLVMLLDDVKKDFKVFFKEFCMSEYRKYVMIQTVKLGNELENLIQAINSGNDFSANIKTIQNCFDFLKQQFSKVPAYTPKRFLDPDLQFEVWAAAHIRDLQINFNTALKVHNDYFVAD